MHPYRQRSGGAKATERASHRRQSRAHDCFWSRTARRIAAIRRTGLVVDEWAILGSFSLTLLRWHPSKLRARLLGDMRAWGTDTVLLEGLSPQLPLGTGDSLRTLVTVGMGMGTEH